MEYKHLPFEQYYIDNTKDWQETGKARFAIKYNHVDYVYRAFGKLPINCSAEYELHYEEDRNVIQINFEQTVGLKDWIANVTFPTKIYDAFMWKNPDTGIEEPIILKACKGWIKMYFAIKKEIRAKLKEMLDQHPDAEIEVVGWSMGTSLAQYCAQDIYYNFNKQPILILFGSVKPWLGGKSVKNYLKHTYKKCYNFVHRSDIISILPPFIGYFMMAPIKIGKFTFKDFFNPIKIHSIYSDPEIYKEIKED